MNGGQYKDPQGPIQGILDSRNRCRMNQDLVMGALEWTDAVARS